MNSGFILPFVGAYYGDKGFSRAVLFDIGNIFFIYTFIYFIAVKHGENKSLSGKEIMMKFVYMPPLWAFVLGIIFVYFRIPIHDTINQFLSYASAPVIPIIMMSIGLMFSPKLQNISQAFFIILIRMGIGFFIGLCITKIIAFDIVAKKIIIAGFSAPCGYNTLIFSSLENLDEKLAATVVSISTIIGIFTVPLIFYFIH